jgi:hypothetical protein
MNTNPRERSQVAGMCPATGGDPLRGTSEPWVCPWGICNNEQAQQCAADERKGCGGRLLRERVAATKPTLAELRQRLGGWDVPEISGRVVKR